jgi:hypothetical protein
LIPTDVGNINDELTLTVIDASVSGTHVATWNGMTGTMVFNGSNWVGGVAGFPVVCGVQAGPPAEIGIAAGTATTPGAWRTPSGSGNSPLNETFGSIGVVGSSPAVVLYLVVSG